MILKIINNKLHKKNINKTLIYCIVYSIKYSRELYTVTRTDSYTVKLPYTVLLNLPYTVLLTLPYTVKFYQF